MQAGSLKAACTLCPVQAAFAPPPLFLNVVALDLFRPRDP